MKETTSINWPLYGIIDAAYIGKKSARFIAEQLVKGGVSAIQLRNKSHRIDNFYADAMQVRAVTQDAGVPFIVNDRLDLAVAVGADGIHVGQSDLPVSAIRRIWGREKFLGVSVHNTADLDKTDPDLITYWGVGTIFPTRTKTDLTTSGARVLIEIKALTDKPIVAIGGITLNNMEKVFRAGADGVALVSGLLDAEDILERTRLFVDKIAVLRPNISVAT